LVAKYGASTALARQTVTHGDTRRFAFDRKVKLPTAAGGVSGGHGSAPRLLIGSEQRGGRLTTTGQTIFTGTISHCSRMNQRENMGATMDITACILGAQHLRQFSPRLINLNGNIIFVHSRGCHAKTWGGRHGHCCLHVLGLF
jgi:hypothetical protein